MKIDLNLLRVFDILMEVRSVSRAADRLGLTQSAVSHALARLREQIDDPLFVRTRGGLRPTPRASEIAPSIRDGLSLLRDALSNAPFEPASATRTFTISASSYFCATVLPGVIQRARAEAPLAQFRITTVGNDLLASLDEGSIDLALGVFSRFPGRLAMSPLFTERLVWIGRAGSDIANIASRPHLAVVRAPQSIGAEEMMARGGLEQRIGIVSSMASQPSGASLVTTHDSLSAGALIARSDLVALVPMQLAFIMTTYPGIAILDDSNEDEIELSMLWHSRSTADPAHVWLRGLMDAAAAALR